MLTKRENLLETIHGGSPEHYVDNFEYLSLVFDLTSVKMMPEGGVPMDVPFQNAWGVWQLMATGEPGIMPLCDDEHKLLDDVCEWESVIKPNTPKLIFSEEDWAPFVAQANEVDRNETFVAPFLGNGIFEKLHYFMGMEDAMCNLYEEPEAMKDLIDYLADWEIKQGEEIMKFLKPDAIFHHDDWGTQRNSFMAPDMFEEFIVPAYEKVYGFWKEAGIEVIVHHSDAYGENLVQFFPRMPIDVWQGVIDTNNIPKLIEEFGGKVSFMGGLNNGIYDKPETTKEDIKAGYRKLLDSCPNQGKHYLIPGLTMGEPGSVYPDVYKMATEAIYELSEEYF